MIGCDPIVAANKATLAAMREGRTYVALNTHGSPTAAFVTNPDWQFPAGNCEAAIARRGRRRAHCSARSMPTSSRCSSSAIRSTRTR